MDNVAFFKEQREKQRRERDRRRPCFVLEPKDFHLAGNNPQLADFTAGDFILVFSPCPHKTGRLTEQLCDLGLDYMDVVMHHNSEEGNKACG